MKTQSAKAKRYLRPFNKYRQSLTNEEYLLPRLIKTASCWEWAKGKDKDGYGQCHASYVAKKAGVTRAHQLAYITWVGKIPKGVFVCHTCDNPSCCNPKHLFLGTPLDNNKDMVKKGRAVYRQRPHKNKQDIIDSWGVASCEKVAARYNLSFSRVCQIWREAGLVGKHFHKGKLCQ